MPILRLTFPNASCVMERKVKKPTINNRQHYLFQNQRMPV